MSMLFRTRVIAADQVARHDTSIRDLRAGEIEAVLVTGVYSAVECNRLCQRLAAGRHDLVRANFPPDMGGFFLGINLNLASPHLTEYFREAVRFREDLAELCEGLADLTARVTALLSALDGGRRYAAAPGPQPGLDHMFTTLRAHPPGSFIPPHFDNEQGFRQSYRYVAPNIGHDLFSFVLAFSLPETGGALEVLDMQHDGRPWRMADGAHDASALPMDDVARVAFRLAPGELILFNSGRYLHRVTQVGGDATRWTACSFMAESRAGDAVYCWG